LKFTITISLFFIGISYWYSGVSAQNIRSHQLFNAPRIISNENSIRNSTEQGKDNTVNINLSKEEKSYLTINKIAARVTSHVCTDGERVASIFSWIVNHINYDQEAFCAGTKSSEDPQKIINSEKAVCTGFSNLFVALCTRNNMDARIITGYAKGAGNRKGDTFNAPNHAWNSVKIDGKWYLLDISWASAYRMYLNRNKVGSEKCELPISAYRDFYLAEPETFVFDHLPEDPAWQLLGHPVSLSTFEKGKEMIQYEINDSSKNLFNFETVIDQTEQLDSLDKNIACLERSIENQNNQYREYNLGIAYYYKAGHLMEKAQQMSASALNSTICQANLFYTKSLSYLTNLEPGAPDYQFVMLLTDNIKARMQSLESRVIF